MEIRKFCHPIAGGMIYLPGFLEDDCTGKELGDITKAFDALTDAFAENADIKLTAESSLVGALSMYITLESPQSPVDAATAKAAADSWKKIAKLIQAWMVKAPTLSSTSRIQSTCPC